MGIDYGRKRTGVAVTDPLQIVANNLATVPTHTLMQFIKDYMAREQVERIIIGQPTQLNGEPSESMKYITPFVNRLRKELPDMPIVMYDERFTSTIANRRDKARVDAIAATIILNDYLQSRFNPSNH